MGLRGLREGAFGVAAPRAAQVGVQALPEHPLPSRPLAVGGGTAAAGEPRQNAELAGRGPQPRIREPLRRVRIAPVNAERPPASAEEWDSLTHRFAVSGHKGYVTVASDEHGRPVHLEIRMSRAGGVLRGLLDSLAVSVSLGLQRGIPLGAYVERLALARFEPAGWTPTEVGYAHSIVDYVFRWLALRFPGAGAVDQAPEVSDGETCRVCGRPVTWGPGDTCPDCGDVMADAGIVRLPSTRLVPSEDRGPETAMRSFR